MFRELNGKTQYMLAIHYVGALLVFVLGLAFLLVWQWERQNLAAGYWGLSHLALSAAIATGYHYQETGSLEFGLVALICTSFFLISLYAGNRSLLGIRLSRRTLVLGTFALCVLIGGTGFGFDQLAGRQLVMLLTFLLLSWSGWYFWSRLGMRDVSGAFLFRAAATAAAFSQGDRISTPQQDAWAIALFWFSLVVLMLTLIKVAVRQSSLRIEQVLRHLPDAVVARRLDGTVLFCNQRFAQLVGARSTAEVVGRPIPLLAVEAHEADRIVKEINAVARLGPMRETIVIERPIRAATGDTFLAEIIYSNYLEFGMTVVVVQVRDISERKRAEAERLKLLSTDPLTGLLNRQGLEVRLDALLQDTAAASAPIAFMAIDLHRFKRFNDAFGAERGDALLRSVSRTLRELDKPGNLVGRTGGDEFVVVTCLPEDGSVVALEQRAHDLLKAIRREEREGDIAILVQANIGIAMSDSEGTTSAVLMQRTQLALQSAKSHGPGEVSFYESSMDARLLQSIRVESALRDALSLNELSLHYQPIVDARTGALVKVEALIRWQSASLGPVSPAVFIPVAEQSQLIIELGRWILDEACRQAAEWAQKADKSPIVGINISVRQFTRRGFEEELLATVRKHGLSPHMVDLELTESLFADPNDDTIQGLLQRLASAGFGLSLDDFGTGYSSLGYLSRFPLTAVKVDRSFVRGMDSDARQRSIVRAIVPMGHSLGLRVVAEGVEAESERQCLIEDNCDLLQGYLLGRPVPPAELVLGVRDQYAMIN